MNWIFLLPLLFTVAIGFGLWSSWRGREYSDEEKRKIRGTILWLAPVVLGSQILVALWLMRHFGGAE